MRSRGTLAALVFAVAGLTAAAAPPCALACSCAQPPSLEVAVKEYGASVFVGRAVTRTGDIVGFAVERWFAGAGAAPVISVMAGNGAMCGIDIRPGDYLVLTATRDESGNFNPSICTPYGQVGTAEANALLAEAQRTFGSGQGFAGDPEPGDPGPAAGEGAGWGPAIALGAAGLTIGGLAVAAVVLLLRRRQT